MDRELPITLVRSAKIPVIGVGESTTRALPIYLHQTLGLERQSFHREVKPVWKMGNQLKWGAEDGAHFNYPFDGKLLEAVRGLRKAPVYYGHQGMSEASLFRCLMDQGKSPCFRRGSRIDFDEGSLGYHIENVRFIQFLEKTAESRGIEIVEGEFLGATRNEEGAVESLELEDGRKVEGDLFIDCSGFQSLLLGKALGVPIHDYSDTLLCDRAVVGSWRTDSEDEELNSFTISETMEHGWCWKIDFLDRVTRGYVYSSAHASDEEAEREFRAKNPKITGDTRIVRFDRNRREAFWVKNVIAVGNSSGFVEPLEATALQMIVEQLRFAAKALIDSGGHPPQQMVDLENERYRNRWDEVRDFLALHYKFNRHSDSAFWKHCREEISLGQGQGLVEYYQHCGVSLLAAPLVPEDSLFGLDGYFTMLLGQKVPSEFTPAMNDDDIHAWDAYRKGLREQAARALPVRAALREYADG